MKAKVWIALYFTLVISVLFFAAVKVVEIDPFFHYHKPNVTRYFYKLNNERSMNNGIIKHFDYDTIITGTSMTQNFKTTELDKLFGTKSVKTPFSGATYKEIHDHLERALSKNKNIKMIVRGLDMKIFLYDWDALRNDLGKYPDYLYNDSVWDDTRYVFNRNVIFSRVYPMVKNSARKSFKPGTTSFDEYANWMHKGYRLGRETLYPKGSTFRKFGGTVQLQPEERTKIEENINKNVLDLAKRYPDVKFYMFFTPYSAKFWEEKYHQGRLARWLEIEECVIRCLINQDNIYLFSFNNRFNITTNLNNYRDAIHYGEWVNSMILRWMSENKYRLTKDNFQQYLAQLKEFYSSYDYNQLLTQVDYKYDYEVVPQYAKELPPGSLKILTRSDFSKGRLQGASIVEQQYGGTDGILCQGSLPKKPGGGLAGYLRTKGYIGFKLSLDTTNYHQLMFYGKKLKNHGGPAVFVYDKTGKVVSSLRINYKQLDNDWHFYQVPLFNANGIVDIIFNGGYVDNSGSKESAYVFSNIMFY
ncbi:MAG: hypothetical protein Q4D21_10615 [Phascolarctobacterium sp.]|nr:hypothetical protein [Phascolarctobacterium sp.]